MKTETSGLLDELLTTIRILLSKFLHGYIKRRQSEAFKLQLERLKSNERRLASISPRTMKCNWHDKIVGAHWQSNGFHINGASSWWVSPVTRMQSSLMICVTITTPFASSSREFQEILEFFFLYHLHQLLLEKRA